MIRRRTLLAGLAAGACLTAAGAPERARAAPASRLIDPRWRQSGGGGDPDHGAWDAILARRLSRGASGVALFDYAGAAQSDRPALSAYIAGLEAVDPTGLARQAAMAFWINLYNAKTIDLVLEAWPVASIREVRGGLFNTGPWDEKVLRVGGAELSLDDVEHGILRPVFADPRIHYAVNCASIGCPDLGAKAWRGGTLDGDLDAAARIYVNHPRGARIDGGELVVSSIYNWFEADFGGSDAGVIAHLARYAEAPLAAGLAGVSGIGDDAYDWSINAA